MKKSRKIVAIVLIVVFGAAAIFSLVIGGIAIWRSQKYLNNYDFSPLGGAANKVVLFIGDGMGFNHIKVTSSYYEKDMFVDSMEYKGEITTFSRSVLAPTDSAAAGSALATGRKHYLGQVARRYSKDVETIAETVKKQGLGVGIVTTDKLSGATPASFSAHTWLRSNSDEIISDQAKSNFDLFLGAGKEDYEAKKQKFVDNGYTFCTNMNELGEADGKIIAAFGGLSASAGEGDMSEAPTLSMLTEFALSYMEQKYPQGYFLMIEGAHIDKRSHRNDVFGMVEYLDNFDESIRFACETLGEMDNTAVLVTADHETGDLQFDGQTKAQISNDLYRRGGHSTANVPYFMNLNTLKSVDVASVIGKRMDNTDIYKIIKAFMGL